MSNFNYVTNVNLVGANGNTISGQIYATSTLIGDYFSVKVPLDCSNEVFKKATGDMILEFPGYQISNSDESVYNEAEQFWIGKKITASC